MGGGVAKDRPIRVDAAEGPSAWEDVAEDDSVRAGVAKEESVREDIAEDRSVRRAPRRAPPFTKA